MMPKREARRLCHNSVVADLPGRAFTLVELLVVIAVIAILAALVLPALNRARTAADGAVCRNNLRQWAIGLRLYAQDTGVYPPYWMNDGTDLYYFKGQWYYDLQAYTGERFIPVQDNDKNRNFPGIKVCPS